MMLAATSLLAALAGQTPSMPPSGPQEQAVSTAATDHAIMARHLAARGARLAFGADTTLAEVVAALGEGMPYGPGREMVVYRFRGDPDVWFQDLWLSFDGRGRLVRALLRTFHDQRRRTRTTLFNAMPVTTSRRLVQLDRSRVLTAEEVFAVWGPPDGEFGSGIQRWEYELVDGGEAALTFYGRCLLPLRRRPWEETEALLGSEHCRPRAFVDG